MDEAGRQAGPITLGVAVSAPVEGAPRRREHPATGEAPSPRRASWSLAIRTSPATRTAACAGNPNLFANAINWLAQQENLIAIRPTEAADRRVTMTARQQTMAADHLDLRAARARLRRRHLHVVEEAIACAAAIDDRSAGRAGRPRRLHLFRRVEAGPGSRDAKPKAFAELAADKIEEIQIKNADGETSRVQRVGDEWQLRRAEQADADAGVVGTVTSNLATLEVQRVVDENPADLKQYGLEPARIDVAFRLKDQKDFQQLLVGEKTPTGGDVYAKRPNEKRVFLVSSYLDAIFNKTCVRPARQVDPEVRPGGRGPDRR